MSDYERTLERLAELRRSQRGAKTRLRLKAEVEAAKYAANLDYEMAFIVRNFRDLGVSDAGIRGLIGNPGMATWRKYQSIADQALPRLKFLEYDRDLKRATKAVELHDQWVNDGITLADLVKTGHAHRLPKSKVRMILSNHPDFEREWENNARN